MSQDNELQRLEEFVESLLNKFTELRAEKARLLQDLRERDETIEGLRENVNSKEVEQDEISLRVNKIVDQIEEWELGLDDSEFDESSLGVESAGSDDDQTDSESSGEGEEDSEEDEDGKGQQNQFSVETS